MKKKIILETLAAALFAVSQAHAAPVSLDNATITATYQVQNTGVDILGYTNQYTDNVSKLDPNNYNVEFMTGDAIFGFDFTSDGQLSIFANMPPDPASQYSVTFDFGNTLSVPITGFTLGSHGVVDKAPVLSVGSDQHSIAVDLSDLTWSDTDYSPITAQLSSDAAPSNVPEPASLALALVGAAGLGLSRRTRRS